MHLELSLTSVYMLTRSSGNNAVIYYSFLAMYFLAITHMHFSCVCSEKAMHFYRVFVRRISGGLQSLCVAFTPTLPHHHHFTSTLALSLSLSLCILNVCVRLDLYSSCVYLDLMFYMLRFDV